MSLAKLTERQFSFSTRSRGQDYYSDGRAELVNAVQFLAEFRVRGARYYAVNFDFKFGIQTIDVKCTCPNFADGFFCKHVWACVLKADEAGIFPEAKTLRKLSLKHPVSAYENLESDEGEDEEELFFDFRKVEPARRPDLSPLTWQAYIQKAQKGFEDTPERFSSRPENQKSLQFVVDFHETQSEGKVCLHLFAQDFLKSGKLGVSKPLSFDHDLLPLLREDGDREILNDLLGKAQPKSEFSYYSTSSRVLIPAQHAKRTLAQISDRGKLFAFGTKQNRHDRHTPFVSYRFESKRWYLGLKLKKLTDAYFLTAHVTDGSASMKVTDPVAVAEGLVLFEDFVAPADLDQFSSWIEIFRRRKEIEIPQNEIDQFLKMFFTDQNPPALTLPDDIQFANRTEIKPTVRLSISGIKDSMLLQCQLQFVYEGIVTDLRSNATELFDVNNRFRVQRDFTCERMIFEQFQTLGLKDAGHFSWLEIRADGILDDDTFIPAMEKALGFGWDVLAHQKTVQAARDFKMEISSGIDWFDLAAEFEFDGATVSLPYLLLSLRSGEKFLPLGNGSYGLLPKEWLNKFGPLAEIAQETETGLRFSKVQAMFLNATLDENVKFKADRKFVVLKSLLEEIKELEPRAPTSAFKGKLRAYQKKGLAWLHFLCENEIGGILADDMGLGKTIQILALLSSRKNPQNPILVVAPKSLIFNWIKEAEKFTPALKILNLTGPGRSGKRMRLREHDIILTTYQSLRMDVEHLKNVNFEYFILDEAHHVKNPKSQAAMACRLIGARKKIALTGTPIENSLTDLFSILAIVLPGLITDSQAQSWAKHNDPEKLKTLTRALTPFILRRTKEQVLKDLPTKSEQVIYCELSPIEMKKYNELKAFYWKSLTGTITKKSFSRSKIEILEALLRLRQAACHQGLLAGSSAGVSSSKFDVLFEQLDSIIKDGHKALIFSQFTSLLALLKPEVEKRQIAYEYLDGQTTDRQQRIENFQNNPDVKLFLLSLKAGGVGLNLTAADYVFILDPWWNPAAEAQAIDRTHRIGQTKKVLAYRLIAKDTVEEKILELQQRKRELARSIMSDEQNILKKLSLKDLEQLFM